MKTNCFNLRIAATSLVLGIAFILVGERSASAQSVLEVIAGGTTNFGTFSAGANTFSGSIDGWNVNFDNGVTSATGLTLSSLSVSTSGTTDPLTIIFSSPAYGPGLYQASASGSITGGLGVVFSSFYGALTPSMDHVLASTFSATNSTPSTLPVLASSTGTITSGGPYSLTEEIVITGSGAPAALSSLNYSLEAVPEPSTIALGLMGAGALLGRRCKRSN